MIRKFLFLTTFIAFIGCKPLPSQLQLPNIISSGMVLQQQSKVSLWGKARPNSEVSISTSWGALGVATVASDSSWIIKLETPKAGDSQQITLVNDDSTLVLSNVLMGEVWLCSGQSNMEMPLAGWPPTDTINNSVAEIAAANYPSIRLFTVARNFSSEKVNDVTGTWLSCTPENAARFSATSYFFGRKLYKEINVPIGLINSSWGGTPAESWITGEALMTDVDYKREVAKLKELAPQAKAYKEWLASHNYFVAKVDSLGNDPIIGHSFFDEVCSSDMDDSSWGPFQIPGNFESSYLGTFDGVVWFRKSINLPASWKGGDLELHLGAIDDRDVTYFNGVRVGAHEKDGEWQTERVYTIPASLVKEGDNLISVRVIDTQGGGGIAGTDKNICLKSKSGEVISLVGEWKHRVVAEFRASTFYLIDPATNDYSSRPKMDIQEGPSTPSMLYNGMVAPITNMTIKGVIWYQGESNVGRAKQYGRIFPLLIESWRKAFNNEQLPFYYVQIAPYDYGDVAMISSAGLRDAQRRTLKVANTGMAVTLDVDNSKTIHPGNKNDVGTRLALWALAKDYGKQEPFSGPLYRSMTIEKNEAHIAFDYVNGGLELNSKLPNGFEIAGSDNKFYPAMVKVDGDQIVVSSPKVAAPVTVRYGYTNLAKSTLFNNVGLPAASFITSEEILE